MSEHNPAGSDGSQDAPPLRGALGGIGRQLARLSSAKEGGPYQGVLSYAAEWHSLVVGFGAGVAAPELATAVVAYALGRGGKGALGSSAHAKDVRDEPAYALAGVVLGTVARTGRVPVEALASVGVLG